MAANDCYDAIAKYLEQLTEVSEDEWVCWFEENEGTVTRDRSVLETPDSFRLEFEDCLPPLEKGDRFAKYILSILQKFFRESLRGNLFLFDFDISQQISDWMAADNRSGLIQHQVTPSFFSRITPKMTEEKAIKCILGNEESLKLYETANAGGQSELSEAFSCELLSGLMIGSELLFSETEIEYHGASSMTDYCVSGGPNGVRIGVSVTRAMEYQSTFTEKDAQVLLQKKLSGIIESTQFVESKSGWKKQILHILAYQESAAKVLEETYQKGKDSLKTDTLVLITTCPVLKGNEKVNTQKLIERIFFSERSAATRHHQVSIGRVKSVFSKEIAQMNKQNRTTLADFSLSEKILNCSHTLYGDKIGGPECQLCGFATTKRIWKCKNDCGLSLCGSCSYKWSHDL